MARRGLSTTSGSSSLAAGCAGVVIVVDVVVGQRLLFLWLWRMVWCSGSPRPLLSACRWW